MSLQFFDSFDHYATGDITMKWTSQNGSPAINASSGRGGTGAIEFDTASEWVRKTLTGNPATFVVGLRVKVAALSVSQDVLKFMDAASIQTTIRIRTDGKLEALRAGSVSLGVSASAAIVANTFAYLEVKLIVNDATGSVDARVNGTQYLNLTSQDTKNTANAYTDGIQIGGDGTNLVTVDDVYMLDTTGPAPQNDFLGDVRIDVVRPAIDGTYAQFTPSTGATRFPNVDDTNPDADATYNSSSTVGHRDSFTMGALTDVGGATIFGVQTNLMARKDGSGTRKVRAFQRISGINYTGSSQDLTTSYSDFRDIWAVNPATAGVWAEVDVNAAEVGYEVAS